MFDGLEISSIDLFYAFCTVVIAIFVATVIHYYRAGRNWTMVKDGVCLSARQRRYLHSSMIDSRSTYWHNAEYETTYVFADGTTYVTTGKLPLPSGPGQCVRIFVNRLDEYRVEILR